MALGIIVVGLLSLFAFIGRSLSLNRVVADQFTASYLAAEGIEVIKNLLDANVLQGQPWNAVPGLGGDGDFEVDYASTRLTLNQNRKILFDGATSQWGYGEGEPTHFSRVMRVRMLGTDEIRVNAIVRWTSRGGSFAIDVEDHFYNWR